MFDTKSASDAIHGLKSGSFVPYFQPQFNYETGSVIGAEVLARLVRPDGSVLQPKTFIPEFETSGLIYDLDRSIWADACRQLKQWRATGHNLPYISVNVSRKDFYHEDFVECLHGVAKENGLSASDIHLEITESAYTEDTEQLLQVLEDLRKIGFVIEMDDFGSGYSSLCALKDMPLDVIKLDSGFLSTEDKYNRCGKIVTAVVKMSHSIDIPVIVEGVETVEQADFLKTVGCRFMQGYYFAEPMDAESFTALLDADLPRFEKLPGIKDSGALDFFDIKSQSTLIFNSYVGGAAIISRGLNGKVSALRMNDKFFDMVGVSKEQFAKYQFDIMSSLAPESAAVFAKAMDDAEKTGEETSCMTYSPNAYGSRQERWYFNRFRFLARKVESSIFYLSLEDVSLRMRLLKSNKKLVEEIKERENLFMRAAEQINLFFWKYDIRTKEMYPCSRCQSTFGLPVRVEDYPEPAIGMCIFPEGEHYREIMKKVDAGEDIDEIMPLSSERVPFRVRYVVEHDKDGNPTVAYATALPVKN